MNIRIPIAIALTLLTGVLFAACGGGGGSPDTNNTPTYTVTYNGNTDTGGSVPIDPSDYQQGQTVTVLDNTGFLVKAGYTFSGWNTRADGSGTTYTPSQTFVMDTANVTLYAKWTSVSPYTVIYNGNSNTGGSVPIDPYNYQQGQPVMVLGNGGSLVKTGYMFSGWNTQADGLGMTYTQGQTFAMGVANVTLYAKWTNYCASGPAAQIFNANMHGCAGAVTFDNRNTLCAAGTRVCSADQWVVSRGATDATYHYWTDDVLKYSVMTGSCGTGNCASNGCFASAGNTYTSSCAPDKPMHICTASQTDPLGNTCDWVGCGFNSISPNQNFGGCGTTAGAVCCSGLQNFFVDAVSGNDLFAGSSAAPFKTISKALSVATASGDQVNVKPGTYDTTNGEIFPLQVPAGVILIGDEPNRGNGTTPTKILGCANLGGFTQSVSLGAGATIAGFLVTCPGGYGVIPVAGDATVRNNSLMGSTGGINIVQGTGHVVTLNTGTGNGQGILIQGTASTKVENNTFTSNVVGAQVSGSTATVDLGGGLYASVGNNTISCNTIADAGFFSSDRSYSADNNVWDHTPPTVSTTLGGGIDIFNNSGVNIISLINSRLTSSACN